MRRSAKPLGAEAMRWLSRTLPDPKDQRAYAAERAREIVVESIAQAMEEANVSRAEMARRLGTTRSAITRMLGGQNLTLRTVGEMLWACGLELADVEVGELGVTYTSAVKEAPCIVPDSGNWIAVVTKEKDEWASPDWSASVDAGSQGASVIAPPQLAVAA